MANLPPLGIDPREIERGTFMGQPVATLNRDELLVIIGWYARQSVSVDRDHAADMVALLGRPRI